MDEVPGVIQDGFMEVVDAHTGRTAYVPDHWPLLYPHLSPVDRLPAPALAPVKEK